MAVLIACEESQVVTIEFRKLGVEAYSCDIQECSGGYPKWHLQQDVIPLLKEYWDLIIAHPECTYLSIAGNAHLNKPGRKEKREEAFRFFMEFMNANSPRICVENPVGYPNTAYRKPDQIIHPYYFGDPYMKRTCLWLKGLPKLNYSQTIIDKPKPVLYEKSGKPRTWTDSLGQSKNRKKIRSKTFPGIAKAMAGQWSKLLGV